MSPATVVVLSARFQFVENVHATVERDDVGVRTMLT